MTLTNEEYVENLNRCLIYKKSLLLEILQITREQTSSIDQNDYDKLGCLVGNKQEKIDEVNKLDEEFENYFKDLKLLLGIQSFENRGLFNITGMRELKNMVGEINTVLKDIQELELENNKKIKIAYNEVKDQIKNINSNKNLTNAYLTTGATESVSYFIDKKK